MEIILRYPKKRPKANWLRGPQSRPMSLVMAHRSAKVNIHGITIRGREVTLSPEDAQWVLRVNRPSSPTHVRPTRAESVGASNATDSNRFQQNPTPGFSLPDRPQPPEVQSQPVFLPSSRPNERSRTALNTPTGTPLPFVVRCPTPHVLSAPLDRLSLIA